MKHVRAGLVLSIAAAFAAPAFAQDATQLAGAVAPMALAQYGGGPDRIDCGSVDMRPARCPVPWRRAVLVRQTSQSACVEGRTWGMRRGAIWVDRGCSGIFAEAGRHHGGPGPGPGPGAWAPGPGWDTTIRVRCASQGFNYNMCQVDTGRGSDVRIERQISDTRCIQGRNWGWNRAGVWVDGGCEAVFRIDRRWR